MSSFMGGKLKLKGDAPLKGSVKKNKKSSKALATTPADGAPAGTDEQPSAAQESVQRKALLEGHNVDSRPPEADMRTEAERKHAATVRQRDEERLRKLAGKSHRDRIKEFNEYLTNLSEHHDIPKVGPG